MIRDSSFPAFLLRGGTSRKVRSQSKTTQRNPKMYSPQTDSEEEIKGSVCRTVLWLDTKSHAHVESQVHNTQV